jgi:hypothetical protein
MTNEHASGFFCCAGSSAILLSLRPRTLYGFGLLVMMRSQERSMMTA